MSVSVIIITKNAEATIGRCIESVAWVDEIVVVDSGSNDRTPGICKKLGARLYVTEDWPGHGPQKNRALDHAKSDWVISLDADEWVSQELKTEMQAAMEKAGETVAYAIPRRSSFCGRYMRHSGWWPDYVIRLFKRGTARFSADRTHERLMVEGKTARLSQPIMHQAISDLEQMIAKMNSYSSSTARARHEQGHKASLITAILHGFWAFFRTYILRLGVLDGKEGFMLAVANAEGSYYRYLKLMLLAQKVGR